MDSQQGHWVIRILRAAIPIEIHKTFISQFLDLIWLCDSETTV